MKGRLSLRSLLSTFVIYFLLCAFVVTVSFLLFFQGMEVPEEHLRFSAVTTFFNVVFITLLFVVMDTVRRELTVDRPVRQIHAALDRITRGDFSVRLDSTGVSPEFARIMDRIDYMTRELSGVETLRTDFIANVSHEMKTPLAVMRNYGTLLQTPGLSEQQRLEYAKAITDGSRRLSDLMTNILKLNRLENQQIYPDARPYDLSEQLCACLLQFEDVWERAGIDIDTDIPDGVTLRADRELLELVWNNLLSNAFKFTPEGGAVRLTLTEESDHVLVRVSDTGCGMSAQVGEHIFEKFYQGDTSHATAGNGLGLALVKRIIDITGGTISVTSALGAGSTFAVRLKKESYGEV